MTSPISFPNIAPRQLVQRDSPLAGLGEFLLTLSNNRKQLALERERLDLEKQRTASGLEVDKLSRDKTKREMELREKKFSAAEIAERYVHEALLTPGMTPEKLGTLRVRMIQENKKLGPFVSAAFDERFDTSQKLLQGIAQRRTAESSAAVATATQPERIKAPKVSLQVAEQQLRSAEVTHQIEVLRRDRDPARVNGAAALWQMGGTWGRARKTFGLAPGGIADDEIAPTTPDAAGGTRL